MPNRATAAANRGVRTRSAEAVKSSTDRAIGSPQEPMQAIARSPSTIAAPIASVPTGMPAGICTIDSSESIPSSVDSGTGTPITGRGVSDASIPGRWAAPPAPAMITLKP